MQDEWDFSFKKLFVRLTTLKAIHWIVIVGIIVYFNMLLNGCILDDKVYLVYNSQLNAFNIQDTSYF
jgi:hypothetical protein